MIMKNIVIFLLILVSYIAAQGLQAQSLDPAPVNAPKTSARALLTGRVTDAGTGQPLSGASVYVPDFKAGAISRADGSFTLTNIAGGRHLIEVSYVGYANYTEYVDIKGPTQKDFILSPSILENNEVVVTGVSTATQLRRSPVPVSIVKRQDLLKGVSSNLIDALGRQPGVSQLSTGPAVSKPFIRGLGYNRVVVVNDGVRQEGQQWGDEHGIEVDEYSVNKVEILKGPASLMYGSDAMAGVINIITNVPVPENTISGNIITNYQTNNHMRGFGANIGGNKNGFNWNAWGTYKAAADYENKYDGRVYNSKFNEGNAGGYIGYNGSWGYSHIIVSSFNQRLGLVEGERDVDGHFIKPLPGGGEAVPSNTDFNSVDPHIPFQKIHHFKITADNTINTNAGRLVLNVGYQRNRRMEYGNVDDLSEKALYFDLNTVTYSAIYHLKQNNNWQISFGANGMSQNNKNKGVEVLIPEYSIFDIGGFVFAQKRIKETTLSGGVRFDNRSLQSRFFEENSDVKFNAFKKDFSNFSGSIGVSQAVSKYITLKFNVARGFRAPSVPELASNGAHEGTNRYEYGDNTLKSETSWQADAGIEFNSQHISFTANLFNNSINNFIFYRKLEAAGGGDSTVEVDGNFIPAFQFNQRKARLSGLEMVLDIHPHPLDWLHVENTFSLVRGKFEEAIEGTTNMPLIPAARLISELRGDFLDKGTRIRHLSIKVETDHTFAQDRAFTAYDTETKTGDYTLVNAGVGADIVAKNKTLFSLYFMAMNIGDVAYQNHLSRLKYAAENLVTGRTGVFNTGRNFSIKLNIPLSFSLQ
jgi:iron complex outermembrane recepter protein